MNTCTMSQLNHKAGCRALHIPWHILYIVHISSRCLFKMHRHLAVSLTSEEGITPVFLYYNTGLLHAFDCMPS